MNEQENLELERLKKLHEVLEVQLKQLRTRVDEFEKRLEAKPSDLNDVQPMEIPSLEMSPLQTADTAHEPTPKPTPPPVLPKVLVSETVPNVPPVIVATNLPESLLHLRTSHSTEPPPPINPVQPKFSPQSNEPEKGSFEMRLGTYWLVRVGIVLLLTGTVFFARYAYQNYFGHLGPLGKVVLMYLGSSVLLGAGIILQKKQREEAMQNYGQMLFAGGLALVYFTTYAAHHIANLRVIPNALFDGALLLAWTAFIVWVADRKKSEVLALFAIGLAYYTSIITTIGLFTLYSNLVLTVAAVFFLLRNRWTRLSIASLVATYVAFVFWRFHSGEGWLWSWRINEIWEGNLFLAGYWIVFTASTFLSRVEESKNFRVPFLTLNNGAFFGLVLLSMLHVQQGNFWKFSIVFGSVLLGLAGLAKRILSAENDVKNSYITQGLLLITLGFISYFSGLRLALILATESVFLFTVGTARKNFFLQAGAYVTAFLATAWAFGGMIESPEILFGVAVGALLLFNAIWAHRNTPAADEKNIVRPEPSYFVVLALSIWGITMWKNCSSGWLPAVLAVETLLFTASFYLLRMPELPVFGQSYLFFAQLYWLSEVAFGTQRFPWWNAAIVITITVSLSHWWQKQKQLGVAADLRNLFTGIYAFAVAGLLFFWLRPHFTPEVWLGVTCLLAIVLTIYGMLTRLWLLAAAGQLFIFASIWSFQSYLNSGTLPWLLALTPIVTLILLGGFLGRLALAENNSLDAAAAFTALYRWMALLMSLAWVHQYIPAREQFWVLMSCGTLVCFLAARLNRGETFLFSAIFFLIALGIFLLHANERETIFHWPNLAALFVLPSLQQLARRRSKSFSFIKDEIHTAAICLSAVLFWIYVSRVVALKSVNAHLFITASWAILALLLFISGLALKERIYRWCGLGILASAVARVFLFDVWKLETIYRILSFMALGLVLLVLGFLYNKYQEKIKDWI